LIERAQEEDKLVMVDAYTEWCGWCKVMDRETFADSETGAYINERFLGKKMDMETGFGMSMAMKHRVSQYPQYLFFDGEGYLLARLSGFMKPEAFVGAVEKAVFEDAHLPKGPAPMNYDLNYPSFYRNSFKKNKDRTHPTGEEVEAWLASRDDLTDEVSWSVMHRYVGGGAYAVKMAELKDELIAKYGRKEVIDKLASLVFNDVKTAIKESDERILYNALRAGDSFLGEDAPKYKVRYRMYYYQMTDDWQRYADVVDDALQEKGLLDEAALQQAAATVNSKCTDREVAQRAVNWIEDTINDNSDYKELLLYAGLLQKSEVSAKARIFAEKAVKKAADEGTDDSAARTIMNATAN
ncbi:MAG: thioredoxin domain-containing protein, partial [Flavobacteriales bacterium]|nr:thioredoxin domain-containing protein [Flavobacteriales bacterium]